MSACIPSRNSVPSSVSVLKSITSKISLATFDFSNVLHISFHCSLSVPFISITSQRAFKSSLYPFICSAVSFAWSIFVWISSILSITSFTDFRPALSPLGKLESPNASVGSSAIDLNFSQRDCSSSATVYIFALNENAVKFFTSIDVFTQIPTGIGIKRISFVTMLPFTRGTNSHSSTNVAERSIFTVPSSTSTSNSASTPTASWIPLLKWSCSPLFIISTESFTSSVSSKLFPTFIFLSCFADNCWPFSSVKTRLWRLVFSLKPSVFVTISQRMSAASSPNPLSSICVCTTFSNCSHSSSLMMSLPEIGISE